jgi:hypothetical protein
LLYLNQIGLPDFAKKPLLEKLHSRGIDLQFSRLRLHFTRGVVADNVLIGGATKDAPKLTVTEVQVLPDFRKLARFQFQINSLLLRQARLVFSVTSDNQPERELIVSNIQTELRFLTNDVWELNHFRAQLADADLQLHGAITNASMMRNWKFAQARPSVKPFSLQDRLRELSDILDQIHFTSTPELKLQISGDARDMFSFAAQLTVRAPGAQTPWGNFNDGQLLARVIPPDSPGELPKAEMTLHAVNAETRWGAASNLDLTVHAAATEVTNFNADLDLTAAQVSSKWGSATDARFTARWLHSPTNPIPISGHGELRVAQAETMWGSGRELQVSGWLTTPTNLTVPIDPSWDRWTNIAPFALNLDCRLGLLQSSNLVATNFLCAAHWRAPHLQISKLTAQLYEGSIAAYTDLAVDTREFTFTDISDFDVKQIFPLLTPMAQHWLSQFSWEKPPKLNASGALVLPAWTNRHPDWRTEVKPTIKLRGHVAADKGAFREVPFDSASLHFTYTNLFWRLPDIVAIRPEGRLEMLHEANDATQDFYFRFHSAVDPRAIRPMLTTAQQRGFDLVGFSTPPVVDAEIWGRWRDLDRIGLKASLTMSNFTFRGESADSIQSSVTYTNRLLSFFEPQLQRGTQHVSAASVMLDMDRERVFVTNVMSTGDPYAFTRTIGPVAARAIAPYHFLKMPKIRVNGSIPFHQILNADLHFDVEGGPLEWWNFKVPQISGRIDWLGDKLFLRGIHADFYGGKADGDAEFDFSKGETASCHFDVFVSNSDLHWLMSDLDLHTNRLEGTLNCRLTVADGDAGNVNSWKGAGHVSLRNGFIWELPVFGVLSPALDGIAPGLGSSRATDGNATYILNNGTLHSDDLEIRASGMRLLYRGDVALNGRVDSRVEAELLRDTWVVGRMLSLALWPFSKIFEYKITGTLAKPKMEPLYLLPRMILMPLHPFETMKDLLAKPPEPANTNAAPQYPN